MAEHPIIFSGPMVRAILEGRKTQTRRIVQPLPSWQVHSVCKPDGAAEPWAVWFHYPDTERVGHIRYCPYGKPGDRLWVRETWKPRIEHSDSVNQNYLTGIIYRASTPDDDRLWKPSIHMPRWASRLNLEIQQVRVQRVQEISEEDAKAEGAEPWKFGPEQRMTSGERGADCPYRGGFALLWDHINTDREDGKYVWAMNPWVWAITFKRLEANHA